MNTFLLNFLSVLFSILYMISILVWMRLRNKDLHKMRQSSVILSLIALGVCVAAWNLAPEAAFRVLFLCIVSIPIIMFTVMTFMLGKLYRILSVLICLTYLPMIYLYLR